MSRLGRGAQCCRRVATRQRAKSASAATGEIAAALTMTVTALERRDDGTGYLDHAGADAAALAGRAFGGGQSIDHAEGKRKGNENWTHWRLLLRVGAYFWHGFPTCQEATRNPRKPDAVPLRLSVRGRKQQKHPLGCGRPGESLTRIPACQHPGFGHVDVGVPPQGEPAVDGLLGDGLVTPERDTEQALVVGDYPG